MVFLGMNALNFEITGITCSVKPFLSEPGIAENVPIVDRAIAYDFKLSHQIYIWIIRNNLYIPSTQHNIIPPFIMREGGMTVNYIPKIYCNCPTSSDHCI